MGKTKLMLLSALAALLLAGPVASQEGREAQWTFTPKVGGNGIEDLLEILERETPANVIYDPAAPQIRGRKVTVKGSVTVPRSQIFGWVRALLFYHRIVLVPTGPREANTWMVLDLNAPQVCSHPEYVPEDEIEKWELKDGAYIVTTVTLKHLGDTSRARNALAQLSTRQIGRINDVPQSRSFVIGDFAPVVHSMVKLLRTMEEEASKVSPEELEKRMPGYRKPPAEDSKSELQKTLERYEQRLMGCHTSQAAQYFLSKIMEVQTKIEKEAEAQK